MFLGFVMLAQHLAVGIHFNAHLLAVLLDDGLKVGAFFFPTDDCSALCLGLRGLLYCNTSPRTRWSIFTG